VAALTALPDLQHLTWRHVKCSGERQLSDSLLLHPLTTLTAVKLRPVSAAALEHLGSLTKLRYLGVSGAEGCAGCPGLQELMALTTLQLWLDAEDLPASVFQLTALQELNVLKATPTALNKLQTITGLTQLLVHQLSGLSLESPLLQLPSLQHLVLCGCPAHMPVSFLAGCTELQVLELRAVKLSAPGSLVASTMLQHLILQDCWLSAADGVAGGPVSWQHVFPGPGRLPHLTSLQLSMVQPGLQPGGR